MNICLEYEKESLGHEITAFRPATGADHPLGAPESAKPRHPGADHPLGAPELAKPRHPGASSGGQLPGA